MTSLSVRFLPKPGNVGDLGLLDIGCRVDAPGAQHGAARRADVGELGGLDAEACQIARPLLGLGLRCGAGTDARLAFGGKRIQILLQCLDGWAQIGNIRRIGLGKPGRRGPAPGGIGRAPSAPTLQRRDRRWQAATQPVDHVLGDDHDPNGSEDGELRSVVGKLPRNLAP